MSSPPDFPVHFYVAYEQACKAGRAAHLSGSSDPSRFNNAFRDSLHANGFNSFHAIHSTVLIAKLVDPVIYMADFDDNSYYASMFPRIVWAEVERHDGNPILHFVIRVMPRWAIQTLLDHFVRMYNEVKEHPERFTYRPALDAMTKMEPLFHLELARRHHNAGRTLYLQTQAATGIEQAILRAAPGINPTPLQKMIAGFLSLSFSNVAPARPAAATSSSTPHKRKAEDSDEEEKDNSRSNKQKL